MPNLRHEQMDFESGSHFLRKCFECACGAAVFTTAADIGCRYAFNLHFSGWGDAAIIAAGALAGVGLKVVTQDKKVRFFPGLIPGGVTHFKMRMSL